MCLKSNMLMGHVAKIIRFTIQTKLFITYFSNHKKKVIKQLFTRV